MIEFEIPIENQNDLLGHKYKLLLRYNTETEQQEQLYDKINAKCQKSNHNTTIGRTMEVKFIPSYSSKIDDSYAVIHFRNAMTQKKHFTTCGQHV